MNDYDLRFRDSGHSSIKLSESQMAAIQTFLFLCAAVRCSVASILHRIMHLIRFPVSEVNGLNPVRPLVLTSGLFYGFAEYF